MKNNQPQKSVPVTNQLNRQGVEKSLRSGPQDVFYYLLMIIMLYLSIISLVTLIFQYINFSFLDALNFNFRRLSLTVRKSVAIIFVAWPIYLTVNSLIQRKIRLEPLKRELKLRKWLLYLTLFLAAVTLIINLITLIFNFLGGELTSRFLLKVASIFLVAGSVFGYYFWDLRQSFEEQERKTKINKICALSASIFILLSILAGFFIIGTPAKQRALRFDEQRVNDLQLLSSYITNYWQENKELPLELDKLTKQIPGLIIPTDPRRNLPYGYKILDENTFQLCAVFETASQEASLGNRSLKTQPLPRAGGIINWQHQEGETCFTRKVKFREGIIPPLPITD